MPISSAQDEVVRVAPIIAAELSFRTRKGDGATVGGEVVPVGVVTPNDALDTTGRHDDGRQVRAHPSGDRVLHVNRGVRLSMRRRGPIYGDCWLVGGGSRCFRMIETRLFSLQRLCGNRNKDCLTVRRPPNDLAGA